jgi:hypothetical protein
LLGVRSCRGSPLISHLFFADDSMIFCKATKASSECVKQILATYEKGSGQCINFNKSIVSFSPKVGASLKCEIKSILGIDICSSLDKYLGLPTTVGRNKKVLFNEIKERVRKKLRGWQGNFFSYGGKEVLIKAVTQAIPTYSMSLFKLPTGFCNDLSGMTSKFWWGSKDGKRKISWISWKRMCLPRNLGGLGFKDLALFNQALLAKQAWRVFSSPDSLAAKFLKAKYFNQGDFLTATAKVGCSHIWRSLMWGKELLSKGLRWNVGDGKSIDVFQG